MQCAGNGIYVIVPLCVKCLRRLRCACAHLVRNQHRPDCHLTHNAHIKIKTKRQSEQACTDCYVCIYQAGAIIDCRDFGRGPEFMQERVCKCRTITNKMQSKKCKLLTLGRYHQASAFGGLMLRLLLPVLLLSLLRLRQDPSAGGKRLNCTTNTYYNICSAQPASTYTKHTRPQSCCLKKITHPRGVCVGASSWSAHTYTSMSFVSFALCTIVQQC